MKPVSYGIKMVIGVPTEPKPLHRPMRTPFAMEYVRNSFAVAFVQGERHTIEDCGDYWRVREDLWLGNGDTLSRCD